jgi:hypothetical protein
MSVIACLQQLPGFLNGTLIASPLKNDETAALVHISFCHRDTCRSYAGALFIANGVFGIVGEKSPLHSQPLTKLACRTPLPRRAD